MTTPTAPSDPLAGRWTDVVPYPDPAIENLDPSFAALRLDAAAIERLYTGARWSEGPVWLGDMRCVLWSDIPNDRVLRWSETTGAVDEWMKPAGFANGRTRDRQGRIVQCEHGARRVTRIEHDGTLTVLADRFDGRPLNSPNDVIVRSDGSVWFTDPPFGILGDYEGHPATPELPTDVYRIVADGAPPERVCTDIDRPNGLAFSPDESLLYVVDCGSTPRTIRVYDVSPDGRTLSGGRTFVSCGDGRPDGIRVDVHGNLWCGWGMSRELNGVRVFNRDGVAIGHIHLPERCANLCFGGVRRNRLFMAASQSLYSLYVNTRGL